MDTLPNDTCCGLGCNPCRNTKEAVDFIVYGTPNCGYCVRAKKFLHLKDKRVRYYDITTDPDAMELVQTMGFKTVPQVYLYDGTHVGGYQELVDLLS